MHGFSCALLLDSARTLRTTMKHCPKCQKEFVASEKKCPTDKVKLFPKVRDPYGLVGRTLDNKYRIDALIGSGGMGIVYSACQETTGKRVAFKILRPELSLSPQDYNGQENNGGRLGELFVREAQNTGKLAHSNIVRVLDAGQTSDGFAYIAMEWIEGDTLEEILKDAGPLSFEQAEVILRQITTALAFAHRNKIIHRDLKPANIIISSNDEHNSNDPHVTVLDFGVSKVISENRTASASSGFSGTHYYASPEQLLALKTIDERTDIYSLGVTLFQMLTGKLPYDESWPLLNILENKMNGTHLPLTKFLPDARTELEELINSMLQKDPEHRPKQIADIPGLYVAATQKISLPPPPPPPPLPSPIPWWRNRSIYVLGGLIVIIFFTYFIKTILISPPPPIPHFKLKLAMAWDKNLPILSDNVIKMAKEIEQLSEGQLTIEVLGAGEAKDVNGTVLRVDQLFDAVKNDDVQMVHSASYYWQKQEPAAVFFAAVPFGLNYDEMNAWLKDHSGLQLWNDLYAKHGLIPFVCGSSGPQYAGWYKKEIKTIKDFRGLRMRLPGLGGEILHKFGVMPISIPQNQIRNYIDNGQVDAVEWIGPYHDEYLELYRLGSYYYKPGWQEPNTMFELIINKKTYDSLPQKIQNIISTKASEYDSIIYRQFTDKNKEGLRTLRAKYNIVPRDLPPNVLSQLEIATKEVLSAYINKDSSGNCAKIYESYKKFQEESRK